MTLTVYALRHVRTGQFMPQLARRGYSHWNPDTPDATTLYVVKTPGIPRLFTTRRAAACCRSQWQQGILESRERQTGFDTWETEIRAVPDGRTRDDLEVVPLELTDGLLP
jgi:hypothetical protein